MTMTKVKSRPVKVQTVADLIKRLGDIPPSRIRMNPLPGTATEQDILDIEARENRLCELIEGVLVEKTTGHFESRIAAVLIYFLETFLDRHDLGVVYGADGTLRLVPNLVRIPDVSFVSWDRLPGKELPAEPIPNLVPDLAIEVLSAGNTPREMEIKLDDYFEAGVRLVWFVDPGTRSATAYTERNKKSAIGPDGTLEGGAVLPGFQLSLQALFARAGRQRKPER
jgi:Uma2 family endonuclease